MKRKEVSIQVSFVYFTKVAHTKMSLFLIN